MGTTWGCNIEADILHVTEGYFRLFGAPVLLGRTFTPQEDAPNGGNVAVVSYGLWQRRVGATPKIIGSALSLGSDSYTIIGALGRDFQSDPEADIWLPFQFEPNSTSQGNFFQSARLLKPGVTLAHLVAKMKPAAAQFHRDWPLSNPKEGFVVEPLRDSIIGDARKSL